MNKLWNVTIVTKINAAVYVAPGTGKHIHKDRPFHGFVLNDGDCIRNYCFDDGRILRTEGHCLFYLPMGSSYTVETLCDGGCYAINFEADISDKPFSVSLRNAELLLHHFKDAIDAWKQRDEMRYSYALRAVYDAICHAKKEMNRQYVSANQRSLIAPAAEILNRTFTDSELSISHLAELCGISEVYFRRLFLNIFGISPKEYIIQKRIEYAKSLLQSGSFLVREIAALCGYAEPCHFSREFTKRVGIPPSQYSHQ